MYCYSYALTEERARQEAKYIISIANSRSQKPAFICIDMEDADEYKAKNGMPDNATLANMCKGFCEEVESAGYYANIYANLNWLNTKLNDSKLDRYDKWVAQWNSKCNYKKSYQIWQYTSNGNLNGYDGRLDMNYAYHNFVLAKNSNDAVKPAPSPEPAPAVSNEKTIYKVVKGDCLSTIGKKLGVDWKKIASENTIKSPYIIYVGQILIIPAAETTIIVPQNNTSAIKKGDKVKVKQGAKDWNGVKLASFVYSTTYNVIEVNQNRVVIGQGKTVTCAIAISNLYKV